MKAREESSLTRSTCLALGIAVLLALPTMAVAQEKGAQKLMKLNRIATVEDAQSVEPGDTVVMSCPKCKDTWVKVVQPTFKGANSPQTKLVKQHQCPGCGTERVTTGHGKTKETTFVHVCKACGSKDANCCVMKKGAGPTVGMKK